MPRLAVVSNRPQPRIESEVLLDKIGEGRAGRTYRAGEGIFAEGEAADTIFYIQSGQVKLLVHSEQGKEAVVGLLGPHEFFGEACLAGQARRLATAVALMESNIVRVEKPIILRLIRDDPAFSELFIANLLERAIRIEADLVDQLFNSSEKRLARNLLLLANFDKEGQPETIIKHISHETLAEMIGTTRSRVSHFMNKFRKLGFIDYGSKYGSKSDGGVRASCHNGGRGERKQRFDLSDFIHYTGGIRVYPSLLSVVLNDQPHIIATDFQTRNADPVGARGSIAPPSVAPSSPPALGPVTGPAPCAPPGAA